MHCVVCQSYRRLSMSMHDIVPSHSTTSPHFQKYFTLNKSARFGGKQAGRQAAHTNSNTSHGNGTHNFNKIVSFYRTHKPNTGNISIVNATGKRREREEETSRKILYLLPFNSNYTFCHTYTHSHNISDTIFFFCLHFRRRTDSGDGND